MAACGFALDAKPQAAFLMSAGQRTTTFARYPALFPGTARSSLGQFPTPLAEPVTVGVSAGELLAGVLGMLAESADVPAGWLVALLPGTL